jgi:hypothetical protein
MRIALTKDKQMSKVWFNIESCDSKFTNPHFNHFNSSFGLVVHSAAPTTIFASSSAVAPASPWSALPQQSQQWQQMLCHWCDLLWSVSAVVVVAPLPLRHWIWIDRVVVGASASRKPIRGV